MSLFDLKPKESPKELFGREQELSDLIRLIEAKRWVALKGPRMVGKTSLLKAAAPTLTRRNIKVIYVNLWGAKGTDDFLKALARAINEEKSIINKIKNITLEGATVGSNGISITLSKKPMGTAWDLLDALGRQKEPYAIELDEVQELAAISGRLLRILANLFNTHSNLTFVFTGSMFGLMKTLLEPNSASPLYGRSPAIIEVNPFKEEQSKKFLGKGFLQCSMEVSSKKINDAVERLDGIPGWLTLYGNKVCVQRLSHERALEETVKEASQIVADELEHFLRNRDRSAYLAALRQASVPSSWTEIKRSVSFAKDTIVNDVTVDRIIKNLQAGMLLQQSKGRYFVGDPMLRSFVLR
ncbi:MAG: ATP-binding protein [Candidatus Bathyarchaeota archaeon]|nr:ATP-binding protein [Candidatus Bathyarchaeota archaeon]